MDSINSYSHIALIPAAGQSSRMGGEQPKVLLELGGQPLLARTISLFLKHPKIDHVFVMVPADKLEYFHQSLGSDLSERVTLIAGGATRQASVRNGLQAIIEQGNWEPERTFVLVHDAARCLVSSELIDRVLKDVHRHKAVSCGVPVVDSIKEVDSEGRVERSLDRSKIWAVQTPQAFLLSMLKKAHECAGCLDATDDACLVEAFSSVYMLPGDVSNIKVTTPEDYRLALNLYQSIS